jgi:mono/diheme cytochrome c family protein
MCHGDTGRGDGPVGLGLVPRPADFKIHMAAGHTDAQLFDWISNGVPGTAMPAWKNELSEEDRWNVLNYIQQSFGPGGSAPAASSSSSP